MRREQDRWFKEALWDFETAKYLHEGGRFNAACFYAQQAAEKAVKALLISRNEAAWGHSVRELLERCSQIGLGVEELISCARELDRHYVTSRYPNVHPAGTPHEAYDEEVSKRSIECCRTIIEFVRRNLR